MSYSSSYSSGADHYFRLIVRNTVFYCVTRDEPRPLYDAAKQVIDSLNAEDRAFIEAIYSVGYPYMTDKVYLDGTDRDKWRKRLNEIHEQFAKTAGLI